MVGGWKPETQVWKKKHSLERHGAHQPPWTSNTHGPLGGNNRDLAYVGAVNVVVVDRPGSSCPRVKVPGRCRDYFCEGHDIPISVRRSVGRIDVAPTHANNRHNGLSTGPIQTEP